MCMFDLVEILILEQKNSAFRNRQRPTTKQLLNVPIFCVCVCRAPDAPLQSEFRTANSMCHLTYARLSHTHMHTNANATADIFAEPPIDMSIVASCIQST